MLYHLDFTCVKFMASTPSRARATLFSVNFRFDSCTSKGNCNAPTEFQRNINRLSTVDYVIMAPDWLSIAKFCGNEMSTSRKYKSLKPFLCVTHIKKVSRHLDNQILISRWHKIIFERYSSSEGYHSHSRVHADRPTYNVVFIFSVNGTWVAAILIIGRDNTR